MSTTMIDTIAPDNHTAINKYPGIILACLLLCPFPGAQAAPVEAWYQEVWCQGVKGRMEIRMEDGRRIDCLTNTHAIEFEFARKWPEAVGQSLDYGMLTGKKSGIVLVLKSAGDDVYWQRLNAVVNHYQLPIRLWKLGP